MGLTLSYLMEFPVIVGFSVLFLLLLTSSYDFFGVYLAIEGLSLTLYTLAGMLHFGVVSVEASIKYYSLGAISTGLFLFGVSLLFGLVGALDFLEVQLFLGGSIAMFAVMEIQLAILCILFGFFFKLSAFPCHIWVADVYEGVCSPITMFFAVVVKVSLLLCFIRIFYNGVSQSCVSNIKVSIDYVFSLYQCVITCVNKFRDWCSIVSSLKVFFDKW